MILGYECRRPQVAPPPNPGICQNFGKNKIDAAEKTIAPALNVARRPNSSTLNVMALTAIRLGGATRQSWRQSEQKSPVSLAGLNKLGAGRPERYDDCD